MKTASKFISLILLVLCFINAMYASEGCFNEYSTPCVSVVITNDEGVFLQVGNRWIATECLQASGEGIFVLANGEWMTVAEALENPDCARETWECSRCHFINYDGVSVCGVCGKPRYAK